MPQLGDTTYIKQERKNKRHLYIWTACEICGKERWVRLIREKPISLRCTSCCTAGFRHPKWKGGRRLNSSGYFEVKITPEHPYYSMAQGRGYVLEHRLILAQNIGRPLISKELSHHKGIKYPIGSEENKQDNRPQNLGLLNGRGEHRKVHTIWKGRGY